MTNSDLEKLEMLCGDLRELRHGSIEPPECSIIGKKWLKIIIDHRENFGDPEPYVHLLLEDIPLLIFEVRSKIKEGKE